jgi:hypothetical protein
MKTLDKRRKYDLLPKYAHEKGEKARKKIT